MGRHARISADLEARNLDWIVRMANSMKFLSALLFTTLVACAGQSQYVNVAAVRDNINDVIKHDQQNPRQITSMGHTTNDSAVVYTKTGDMRHEESWVRSDHGWTLASTKDLTASAN